jgi:hypothetical protein
MPDDALSQPLYGQDFYAWATQQAAALRAARDAFQTNRDPSTSVQALNWDNLAEEIEGSADRDRRELGSRIALMIEHLAKLECSTSTEPRLSWITTVRRERAEAEAILRDSPSLRRLVPDLVSSRTKAAVEIALDSLAHYGEPVAPARVRLAKPYTPDDVLGPWLPGDTAG